MNITEIRQKYPQYDDLSDEQLAQGLHKKYYSDMPYEQFSEKIGLSKAEELPPSLTTEEIKQKAQEQLKDAGIDTSLNSINNAFAEGFQKGYLGGAERVASGVSLGAYDWASDKLGLGSKERKKELEDLGASGAMTGTEVVSGLIPSVGIWKGASALSKGLPKGLGLLKYPVSGAVESGISSGFSENGDVGEDALTGAALSTAIPLSVSGVGKVVKGIAPKVLGLTTGSGDKAIEQAYSAGKRGSKTFLNNLRGNVEKTDVVDMAREKLNNLKIAKNQQYAKAMSEIAGKEGVDLKPIVSKYKEILKTEAGGKKYLIDEDTKKFLKKAGKTISQFQKDKTARSLSDFDNLKQAIGNINVGKDAKRAAQVQGQLYNAIKGEIKKQAPVYDKIMKPYSEAAEKVREIEKTLSLDRKANVDTSLRKLQSAFRNTVSSNYGNRGKLVEELGGTELSDAISGQLLGDWIPRGGVAKLGAGGIVFTGGLNPSTAAGLTATSPRAVGEAVYGIGKASKQAEKLKPALMPTLLEMISNSAKGEQ